MSRSSAIHRIRIALEHRGSPRREMMLGVTFAALAGFAASYTLLQFGLTRMAIRYPTAVTFAYLTFLAYLWFWLRRHALRPRSAPRSRKSSLDLSDLDVVDIPFSFSGPSYDTVGFGQGGGFSGGGGGADWSVDGPLTHLSAAPASSSSGDSADFGIDLGDGGWVLIPVAIAFLLVLAAALYVVYIAPVFLAELMLDAALAAGLYRRLRGIESRNWMVSAVRRTAVPALASAALLSGAGALMQAVYPEAASIGKVWIAATRPDSTR